MYGWNGTILRVDLTNQKISKQRLERDIAENFIGGRGLAIKVLWDELKPGVDPLSPENVLCLTVGPLVGTGMARTSRIEVSTLSPLTNILGDGNAGGFFPTALKLAGYDQIVITGKAEKPVYILIDDEHVDIKDASHLWGKTTWETTAILQKQLGKEFKVACIGQAGENLVKFANTIFDCTYAAARGSGAVWGSKNLKAIAVRGTQPVKIADAKEFSRLVKMDREFLTNDKFHHEVIGSVGTWFGMVHWWPSYRHESKSLAPDEVPYPLRPEYIKRIDRGRKGCFGCPIHCKSFYDSPSSKYGDVRGACLEFETLMCCGTNAGITDLEAIMVINNLADQYGMCTIPLGYVISYAKKLYEEGLISEADTGGIPLRWEDADTTIKLVHMIARREGFGNELAEGYVNFAKKVAERVGKRALDYCYHTKGLSRGVPYNLLVGLLHATSTRGADHLRGDMVASDSPYNIKYLKDLQERGLMPTDIPELAIWGQRIFLLADCLINCKCGVYTWPISVPLIWKYNTTVLEGPARILSAATGVDYDTDRLVQILDRIYTLERAFNVRQAGISRKDDTLPEYPEIKNTPEGIEKQKKFQDLLTEYYRLRGWDEKTGRPTRETLERLGLKYVADELEKLGKLPD